MQRSQQSKFKNHQPVCSSPFAVISDLPDFVVKLLQIPARQIAFISLHSRPVVEKQQATAEYMTPDCYSIGISCHTNTIVGSRV